MTIVDHGDRVVETIRTADIDRAGAVAGDGVGARHTCGAAAEGTADLIEIIAGGSELAASVGGENNGLGKCIDPIIRLIDSNAGLRDHILALQAGLAEAAAEGLESAGAAGDCQTNAGQRRQSQEHTSGTLRGSKAIHKTLLS